MFCRILVAAGLALCLTGANTSIAGPRQFTDFMFHLNDELSLDLSPLFGPNALDASQVQAIAQSSGSYDAFLSSLKDQAPELFDNYVLLHHSRSLQEASFEQPRVILFGGGLFLGFFEDDKSPDRLVEMLAFDRASASFSAFELRFPAGGTVQLKTDPVACAACHGKEAKPLWDPYDFWPNAYGAGIGRFHSYEESSAYERFFKDSHRRGIGAYLNDQSQVDSDPRQRSRRLDSLETFTQYTAALNFLRIAGKINGSAHRLGGLKYALYAALSRCERSATGFARFFPPQAFAQASRPYADLVSETQQARQKFKNGLETQYQAMFPDYKVLFAVDQKRLADEAVVMAQVRFIAENIGLSIEDWPSSSGSNPYFLSTPANFSFDLLAALAPSDAVTMRGLGAVVRSSFLSLDCASLVEHSRQALQDFTFPINDQEGLNAPIPVAGACSRCHNVAGGVAPRIPFDDAQSLRTLLRQQPTLAAEIQDRIQRQGQGKMPPAGRLSDRDIEALTAYVARLAN